MWFGAVGVGVESPVLRARIILAPQLAAQCQGACSVCRCPPNSRGRGLFQEALCVGATLDTKYLLRPGDSSLQTRERDREADCRLSPFGHSQTWGAAVAGR